MLSISIQMPVIAEEAGVQAEDSLLQEARQIANKMPPQLMAVLQEEIGKNGFASAINVCRDKAPKMAMAASASTGWHIRRVSEKNRNPKAVPDAWELAALQEFATKANEGVELSTLEKSAITDEGGEKYYRYMKALPTNAMCLNCHGTSEQIHPDVKAALLTLYPEDKAIGYDVNQIRGAITLKRIVEKTDK